MQNSFSNLLIIFKKNNDIYQSTRNIFINEEKSFTLLILIYSNSKLKKMKAHQASLINAILLIVLGLWGYFGSVSPSPTAFIPVVIGIALILLNKGLKSENKAIAHAAVMLTLVVFLGLIKPLVGSIGRADNLAITRVVVMMISTILALVYFIKSFIDARKSREVKGE
jgi:hypothetical protein